MDKINGWVNGLGMCLVQLEQIRPAGSGQDPAQLSYLHQIQLLSNAAATIAQIRAELIETGKAARDDKQEEEVADSGGD